MKVVLFTIKNYKNIYQQLVTKKKTIQTQDKSFKVW